MHRFAKAGVVITMGAALAVGIPGIRERIRERGALLVSKLLGSSKEPWNEVAVQMAPHRWQKRARKMLGPWDEWSRHLNYPLELGSEKVRMYQYFPGCHPQPWFAGLSLYSPS